jgi:hypothetical protein
VPVSDFTKLKHPKYRYEWIRENGMMVAGGCLAMRQCALPSKAKKPTEATPRLGPGIRETDVCRATEEDQN